MSTNRATISFSTICFWEYHNHKSFTHKITFFRPFVRHLSESVVRSASAVYQTLTQAYSANKALILSSMEELRQVCIQVCQSVAEQYIAVAEYSQARWTEAKQAAIEQAVEISRNVVVALGPYAETIANVTRQYAEGLYNLL